jgi:hypothetical protein
MKSLPIVLLKISSTALAWVLYVPNNFKLGDL